VQSTSGQFHYRYTTFSSHLKSKVGNILVKTAGLRITLNIDGTPVASKSHTHPSHSTTSRLLTSCRIETHHRTWCLNIGCYIYDDHFLKRDSITGNPTRPKTKNQQQQITTGTETPSTRNPTRPSTSPSTHTHRDSSSRSRRVGILCSLLLCR
jgi:hypothetical protein